MRWTPWTGRSWTVGSYGSRWRDTAALPTPTTGDAEEDRRAGGAAALDAEAGAILEAQGEKGKADPAAGAALVPEAGPATADPGPTQDPNPAPPETKSPRYILPQDLDPGPTPNRGPGPEVAALPPKRAPGPDPKVRRNRERIERSPLGKFRLKTSEFGSRAASSSSSSSGHLSKVAVFCFLFQSFLFSYP